MPVARYEEDAVELLRVEPLGERAPLGRELVPSLEAMRPAPELAAAGDDLDRTAWCGHERLLQPFELASAEHRLLGAVGPAVGIAVVAVVEQEEKNVAVARCPERAGKLRKSERSGSASSA